MELTQEQKNIIETVKNISEKEIKIDSVAGSGKSFVLIEVAKKYKELNPNAKMMYFVFNRLMVEEARGRFKKAGVEIECFTTHSFALRRFKAIKNIDFEPISDLDFKTFMEIKNKKEYTKKWINFKNMKELFNQYCLTYDNIDTYCDKVKDRPDKFNIKFRVSDTDIKFLKDLLKFMIKNNIYSHNLYLKLYACECNDKIKMDLCELDECQDTNLMFYSILRRMDYKKFYATGDKKQNIYQFCKTVNIFEKLPGKTYPLSVSFRINNKSCDLANRVLAKHYDDFKYGDLKNIHNSTDIEDKSKKTILFRRNATMLSYVVDLLSNAENIKVSFLGTNNGSATDGFESCFNDMLYFYYQLLLDISSEKAQEFKSLFNFKYSKEVKNYQDIAEKESTSLYRYLCRNKSILSLDFKKFFEFFLINERNIIDVVQKVKQSEECVNPNKTYYLSSAHRYKGLEAEHVKIAPDEWSISSDAECNLVYIALTRNTRHLEAQCIEELLLK